VKLLFCKIIFLNYFFNLFSFPPKYIKKKIKQIKTMQQSIFNMAEDRSKNIFRRMNLMTRLAIAGQRLEKIALTHDDDIKILNVDPKRFTLKEGEAFTKAHLDFCDLRFELQKLTSKIRPIVKGIDFAIEQIIKLQNSATPEEHKRVHEWLEFITKQFFKIIKPGQIESEGIQEINELIDRLIKIQGELAILKIILKEYVSPDTDNFLVPLNETCVSEFKSAVSDLVFISRIFENPDPLSTIKSWGFVGSTRSPPLHGKEYDAELEKVGLLAVTPEQIKRAEQLQQEMEDYAKEQKSDD
jgi:hypothetical protein